MASLVITLLNKNERTWLPKPVALKSLNNDKDIFIPPTDKGRATEVMNISVSVKKMKDILSDTQAYTRVEVDPTKKQITTLSKIIQKLVKNCIINPNRKT